MKISNKEIGALGEDLVSKYLLSEKFYIFEKNYSCFIGEVDIIAKDNDHICFIEVKARYDNKYGLPCESITLYKQNKIKRVAQKFIVENKLYNHIFRFDVAEVFLDTKGGYSINYIKNAFWYN